MPETNLLPTPVPAYLHRATNVHPVVQYGREQVRAMEAVAAGVGLFVLALLITALVKF